MIYRSKENARAAEKAALAWKEVKSLVSTQEILLDQAQRIVYEF